MLYFLIFVSGIYNINTYFLFPLLFCAIVLIGIYPGTYFFLLLAPGHDQDINKIERPNIERPKE